MAEGRILSAVPATRALTEMTDGIAATCSRLHDLVDVLNGSLHGEGPCEGKVSDHPVGIVASLGQIGDSLLELQSRLEQIGFAVHGGHEILKGRATLS